jgi:hypothetical protein
MPSIYGVDVEHCAVLLQDSEVAGYPIAKGTSVAVNIYAMHRWGQWLAGVTQPRHLPEV